MQKKMEKKLKGKLNFLSEVKPNKISDVVARRIHFWQGF
jgi:hypothetical protein